MKRIGHWIIGTQAGIGLALAIAAAASLAAPDQTAAAASAASASISSAAPAGAVETEETLGSGRGAIHGTLLLPVHSAGRVPLVLLIAGSGPTDRNGNSAIAAAAHNDSLHLLANALAQAGFASLRYDKRGVAASAAAGPAEADLRFDDYVQDAADWVQHCAADPRFSAIAIVGHSEGALIGMRAAARGGVRAFVSIAGAGAPAGETLRHQLRGRLPPDLAAASERILQSLEAGQPAADVPPALNALYRPSVQPYLISYLRVDPVASFAALTVPAALFQGDTDIQITPDDAQRLARARPAAELHVVSGMNHVLKLVPADPARQRASYDDPTLPLAPALTSQLADFLHRALAG